MNFNKTFDEMLTLFDQAAKAGALIARHSQRCQRFMYRAAVKLRELRTHFPNDFSRMMKSYKGGIDAMIEHWFRPLDAYGEDYNDLLHDIAEGMTEKEYLSRTAGSYSRQKRLARIERDSQQAANAILAQPLDPIAEMTDAEKIAHYKARAEALHAKLQDLSRHNRELHQVCAQQEKKIKNVERLLRRMESSLQKAG